MLVNFPPCRPKVKLGPVASKPCSPAAQHLAKTVDAQSAKQQKDPGEDHTTVVSSGRKTNCYSETDINAINPIYKV